MSFLRSSVLAVLASAALGATAAGACQTSDLAGEWAAAYLHGTPGYCTLTVDDTGAVTDSRCWLEKFTADPQFSLAGTLAVDDACMVSSTFTPGAPGAAAAAAKAAKGKGGGHGVGHGKGGDKNKTVTLAGRLLTGNEVVNGILTDAQGRFSPVVFTRLK